MYHWDKKMNKKELTDYSLYLLKSSTDLGSVSIFLQNRKLNPSSSSKVLNGIMNQPVASLLVLCLCLWLLINSSLLISTKKAKLKTRQSKINKDGKTRNMYGDAWVLPSGIELAPALGFLVPKIKLWPKDIVARVVGYRSRGWEHKKGKSWRMEKWRRE